MINKSITIIVKWFPIAYFVTVALMTIASGELFVPILGVIGYGLLIWSRPNTRSH